MMSIIGFLFVLCLGVALMFAGITAAWLVVAFSGRDGLSREWQVPLALFLIGLGCLVLAVIGAPFEITWEMK